MYLWMDCDTWVQERFAVDWLLHAARDGTLAIVPEWDRAYLNNISLAWRINQSTLYYDLDFVRKWLAESYFNSGVFALAADAPHWERWAIHFERGLNATQGKMVCDQTALNGALWSDALPVHPLPSLCNWLCHLAYPQVSPLNSKLCEPFTPRSTLGIIHLTGHTKRETILFNDTQGRLLRRNLRRSAETSA
jgi:lipopolysaccharide biosynthesis glycosyltransferase